MLLRFLPVVAVSVMLALAAGAQGKPGGKKAPAERVKAKVRPPVIKAGDPIVIELLHPDFDAPNVSSTYTVSVRGTLKMPRMEGEIEVAGLTFDELTKALETRYRDAGIYEEPVFRTGFVAGCGCVPHLVSVGGAVKKTQGAVPQRDGMRLMKAITAAGGFSELADVKQVKLIRGTKETFYNLERVSRDNSNNPVLKDGDTIYVLELKEPKTKTAAAAEEEAKEPAAKRSGDRAEPDHVIVANPPPPVLVKAGDRLTVKVKRPASDPAGVSADYVVDERGTVRLPRLEKPVPVAGLTCEDLAQRLAAAFREGGIYRNPGFAVSITATANGRVTVTAIKEGGGRRISINVDGIRLYSAIMLAGGPGEFESVRRIGVLRDGKETIYDVRRINADGSNNPVLTAGDVVVLRGEEAR